MDKRQMSRVEGDYMNVINQKAVEIESIFDSINLDPLVVNGQSTFLVPSSELDRYGYMAANRYYERDGYMITVSIQLKEDDDAKNS